MPSKFRVPMDLSVGGYAALDREAVRRGMSRTQLAKLLVETALASTTSGLPPFARANAELQLMAWVERKARERADADDWGQHVTLEIFMRIRDEIPDLHRAASADGHQMRINREIGHRIRLALMAEPCRRDGKVRHAAAPRGHGHVIKTYTLLCRPEGS